jgi:hypothetical protein
MTLSLQNVYFYTILILGLGYVIKCLELISIRETFEEKNPNDWNLVGLDTLQASRFDTVFRAVYSKSGIVILCVISILFFLFSILFFNDHFVLTSCIASFFICQLILHHRQEFGGDGADQMSFIILTTFTLCFAFSRNEQIQKIGISFVSGQLILSYIVAGWSKVISKEWQNGSAIQGILSSYTYGAGFTRKYFTSNLRCAKLVAWGTIAFESLFPLVLISNVPVFFALIGLGLLMHLAIGIVMGLNDFIWSFAAAYPSLMYLYFAILN